jgi:hypothetical protein
MRDRQLPNAVKIHAQHRSRDRIASTIAAPGEIRTLVERRTGEKRDHAAKPCLGEDEISVTLSQVLQGRIE